MECFNRGILTLEDTDGIDLGGETTRGSVAVSELDLIVRNPEVHRARGATIDHDRVPAGVPQLGAAEFTCLRFAERLRCSVQFSRSRRMFQIESTHAKSPAPYGAQNCGSS
jgi:hypothetical protein